MRSMVFEKAHTPLTLTTSEMPEPRAQEVLIKVNACGICRTDLHLIDGELKEPKSPLIPGHQIVGQVVKLGKDVTDIKVNDRIGVPWLGLSCGRCEFCESGRENLCDHAKFTGYQLNGGFAEYCIAHHQYCFPIPDGYPDHQAAPLLCAGLIGYRAYRKTGNAKSIGIYGFGSAAHIMIQVAHHEQREVYAFTKPGDKSAQQFALDLGAIWAGDSNYHAPCLLDAAIIFAPIGELVPYALRTVKKGGIVVCAGIHMSDIPSFPYDIMWGERSIVSVANLTRQDGEAFLALAPQIPIKTEVTTYALNDANKALDDLRHGRFHGAGVIVI